MKKGWKIFWIVSGITAAVGIVLCIVGLVMGASLSALNVRIGNTGLHIVDDGEGFTANEFLDDDYSTPGPDTAHAQSYDNVKKVNVDVAALELDILKSKDDLVWIETENLSSKLKFRCGQEGDELKLQTVTKLSKLVNLGDAGTVRLYLPEKSFEEIEITNGAGTVMIEYVNAEKLSLDVGAGEAVVKDFDAAEADMECGAGEITASGDVAKQIDIECGVGEISLTLEGTEEDYACDVDCGVGEVAIGNRRFEGLGNSHDSGQSHHGKKTIDVECGIGSVTVRFASGI